MNWRERYSRIYPEPKGEDRIKHLRLQHGLEDFDLIAAFANEHPRARDYDDMDDNELLQDPEFKRWTEGWHDGIFHHPNLGINHDHA